MWRFQERGNTEIHTMFEYANQKGLVGLSIPPVHWNLHVVDVGQRHFQLPVEERADSEFLQQTENNVRATGQTLVLSHMPSCKLRH